MDDSPEALARQRREWMRCAARSFREGMCPDSGLQLFATDGRLHCGVCDCFGYTLDEITRVSWEAVIDAL